MRQLQGPPTLKSVAAQRPARARGKYETVVRHGSYDVWEETHWTWAARADLLTSLIRDGKCLHAPVLDVDREITATPTWDGHGTVLTVPGVRAYQAVIVLSRLSRGGFAHPDLAKALTEARAAAWRSPMARVTLTAPVNVTATAHPSRTAGHHHVLVDTVMSWNATKCLVRALRGPVVDRDWARANLPSKKLVINRPLTSGD